MTITKPVSKSARGMNEQLLIRQVLIFYPPGKKSEKPYGSEGGIHPPPPSSCSVRVKIKVILSLCIKTKICKYLILSWKKKGNCCGNWIWTLLGNILSYCTTSYTRYFSQNSIIFFKLCYIYYYYLHISEVDELYERHKIMLHNE